MAVVVVATTATATLYTRTRIDFIALNIHNLYI